MISCAHHGGNEMGRTRPANHLAQLWRIMFNARHKTALVSDHSRLLLWLRRRVLVGCSPSARRSSDTMPETFLTLRTYPFCYSPRTYTWLPLVGTFYEIWQNSKRVTLRNIICIPCVYLHDNCYNIFASLI